MLRVPGIRRAFLDVSGDCFALGAPPGEDGWGWSGRPERPGGVIAVTRIRDAAIATSSNTGVGRALRAGRAGTRHGPRDWMAGATLPVQVTVVARTGIEADALSTAMLVSGKQARWRCCEPMAFDRGHGRSVPLSSAVGRGWCLARRSALAERTRARSRSSTGCLFCQSSDGSPA